GLEAMAATVSSTAVRNRSPSSGWIFCNTASPYAGRLWLRRGISLASTILVPHFGENLLRRSGGITAVQEYLIAPLGLLQPGAFDCPRIAVGASLNALKELQGQPNALVPR